MNDPSENEIKEVLENADLPKFPDFSKVKKDLQTKAKANFQHTPRQQGPYLICVSCEYPHTLAYIGPFKKLTGFTKKGEPIFKDVAFD